ncbi:hypothetical protein FHS14_002670 [Paenibacillus baekrokdamisoli]|nr:DUF2487 family protein [Paenibacillus baekrokdamisoli]MBB3069675.1 hypothetical protein [Paenibacillus baekrokdamisoli]
MKFSDLSAEQWAELQPYLDTAILPLTGLSGSEMPHEATAVLENLRDVLDLIEGPFKGRVVVYPACHYVKWDDGANEQLAVLCSSLKQVGFRYVIIAAAFQAPDQDKPISADMVIGLENGDVLPSAPAVSEAVRTLWLGRA